MSKIDLKANAKAYFEQYPSEKSVLVTTDGQIFNKANLADAKNHAIGDITIAEYTNELTVIEAEQIDDTEKVSKLEAKVAEQAILIEKKEADLIEVKTKLSACEADKKALEDTSSIQNESFDKEHTALVAAQQMIQELNTALENKELKQKKA